jgi:OpgC protein
LPKSVERGNLSLTRTSSGGRAAAGAAGQALNLVTSSGGGAGRERVFAQTMRAPNEIDFWRGFALVTIFINHIPGNYFERFTFRNVSLPARCRQNGSFCG